MQSETHADTNGTPIPAAEVVQQSEPPARPTCVGRSLDTDDPNGPRLAIFLLAAHKAAKGFRRTLKQSHPCTYRKTFCGSCGRTHVENCNFCDMRRAVQAMLAGERSLLDHHEAIDMNIMDERAIQTRHATVIRRLERALDRIIDREVARHKRESAEDERRRNTKTI